VSVCACVCVCVAVLCVYGGGGVCFTVAVAQLAVLYISVSCGEWSRNVDFFIFFIFFMPFFLVAPRPPRAHYRVGAYTHMRRVCTVCRKILRTWPGTDDRNACALIAHQGDDVFEDEADKSLCDRVRGQGGGGRACMHGGGA